MPQAISKRRRTSPEGVSFGYFTSMGSVTSLSSRRNATALSNGKQSFHLTNVVNDHLMKSTT
ncbi:MAG: hypothetical protein ACTS42_00145 [Candidatus Hodgkinia cicadicola]